METKVISGTQFTSLPSSYIRPESDRPNISEVADCNDVPVVDLACEDRSLLVKQIGDACREYGFFQVINHAVPKDIVDKMVTVAHEFFSLSVEEKMKLYSDDPSKTMRLSTSFNVRKETVHNWRDYLRLHCYPLENYVPEWPSNPSSFKDIVSTYCKEVRALGFRLQEAISESLGLHKDCLKNVLGEQGQHKAINYYPTCPEPDLTYGLLAHTDPNALTILLQDLQVSGLNVLKDGKWLAVKPQPDAFVIIIGDQLQAFSNGKYRSVWHCAVVNAVPIRSILRSCFQQGLPENAVACILKETLKALHYMHEEEEVCGNIGAGSVFLDDYYRVRITSSITPENRRSRDAVDLGYMSDYGVGGINKATDTLMFGFLALELFYGEVPSSEEFSLLVANEFGKKQQKRRRFRIKFRVLSCFRGERERKIPRALAEVMAACLCRDEKARPTTAELMEFSLFQTTFVGDLISLQ